MTSGQGGQDPQGWQGQPPQGWQTPPQGWQAPPPPGPYGYAPAPSAPGWEPPPAPERPTTVRVGVGAFIATLILGLISSLVQFSDVDSLVAETVAVSNDPALTEDVVRAGLVVGAVVGLLLVALEALFIWFAWQGRNWARIVLWVLGGLSVLFGLVALGGAAGGAAGSGFLDSLSVISLLLTVVGIVALGMKPSNEWYTAVGRRRAAGLR
ncbi:hypothetical protein ACI789_10105 [Geodermatophilus sp. SYSU D00965]